MFEKVLSNEQLMAAARMLAGLGGGASGTPGVVKISGVWGSSGALVAAAIGRLTGRPVLFVTAHLDEADEIADDFEVFTGQGAAQFPAWEVDIGTQHVNDEVAGERIRMCNELEKNAAFQKKPAANYTNYANEKSVSIRSRNSRNSPPVSSSKPDTPTAKPLFLVTSIMALLQPVPTAEALAASRLTLVGGMEMGPEELAGWLVDGGFEHVEQVDGQGEFARRGGIIDILPLGVTQAIRVEFFGDQIESIRKFDLDTQRSTEQVQSYDVSSAKVGAAGVGVNAEDSEDADEDRMLAAMKQAQDLRAKQTTLLSYLSPDTIVAMREPAEVRELAQEIYRRTHDDDQAPAKDSDSFPRRRAAGLDAIAMRPVAEVFDKFDSFARVEMHSFSPKRDLAERVVDLGIRSLESLSANTHEALVELSQLAKEASVVVYCQTPAEESRFVELLQTSNVGLVAQRAGSVSDGANQSQSAKNSMPTEYMPA